MLELDKLRLSINAGVAAVDSGDYTDIDNADLDARFGDLLEPASD
ncbi:MAG TPA: hypothetical protein VFJ18_02255 [Pararhizobium sp.]|nr:hypothetical protein [Pararhizobium sp.]